MLGEDMYSFFCAKATSLPRFEKHRHAKKWPTFAAGKSGEQVFEVHFLMTMLLVPKVKFAPRHHEEVCFCLWQRNASEKASTPPNSHSLFFSGCLNPLRFTCFWCVPQRCWSRYFFENQTNQNKKRMIGLDSWTAQVMCSSVLCLILATVLKKLGLPESACEARQPL